jgi:SAM-dependent methyltransferase
MSHHSLFAAPWEVPNIEDCSFYHVMELPGYPPTEGEWDLRSGVDQYLGGVSLQGQRVLEIGPASGCLTFEMEKRGAEVVCVEVPDEACWDFVPYPSAKMEAVFEPRREGMRRLKNSFWFSHAAYGSNAQVCYGSAYELPEALGRFDVALMGSVLLHCHSPLQIVEQCARKARSLVITDMFYPELEGKAICRLAPTPHEMDWDTWWHFSTDVLVQFLGVLGFPPPEVTTHVQQHRAGRHTLFTIVATRPCSP